MMVKEIQDRRAESPGSGGRGKKLQPPFSRYLLFYILIIVLLVASAVTYIDYRQAEETYQDNAKRMQQQTEADLDQSIRIVDAGFRLYDDALNVRMETGFSTILQEYEKSGRDPSKMDLQEIKEELGGAMDIYVINDSMMIEHTTYSPDLGLDFSQWPYTYNYFRSIITQEGFFPDRVVHEVETGNLRKYAYMPSPDHRYIFELGLVEEEMGERAGMEYREPLLAIAYHNPGIREIQAYDTVKREIGTGIKADAAVSEFLDRVSTDKQPVEIVDRANATVTRYILVDIRDPLYASDTSWILRLTYDTLGVQTSLNNLLFFHGMVAAIAILMSAVLTLIASRRLSSPLRQIVDDVDRIAQGDLDHRLAHSSALEMAKIEESVNALVDKLKGMITQLRQRELDLKESEERYRAVVEGQTEMIARFLPDRTHIFANEAYCRYFNLDCENIQGKRIKTSILPEEREFLSRYFSYLTPDKPTGTIEHRIRMSDNEIRWHHWNDRAIFDQDGRLLEYQSVGRDITDKKIIEQNLIESERKFRDLANLLPQVIFEINRSGLLTYVNQPAFQIFGYTEEEFAGGLNFLDFIHPLDKQRALQNFNSAIWSELSEPSEYRVVRRNAPDLRVMVYSSPIVTENKVMGIRGILVDITTLKRVEDDIRRLNEELEQRISDRTKDLETANRELEAFSYSVSHDLRAPLRAIDGFSSILATEYAERLDPSGKEYIGRIRSNAQRMGNLIDAILNFSRMSRQPLAKQQLYPAQLAHEVVDELLPLEKGRAIDVSMGEIPPSKGDPALVKQVFYNLISNSLKFTRNREKAVISIGSMGSDGRTVYFVKDNGVGFDMKYVDKLFSVFQRLHDEKMYEGTGIGLAIAQRIIQRHGGQIWAEGKVDEGAAFYFTLE
jgi:PAS domain S-box-containing protein